MTASAKAAVNLFDQLSERCRPTIASVSSAISGQVSLAQVLFSYPLAT